MTCAFMKLCGSPAQPMILIGAATKVDVTLAIKAHLDRPFLRFQQNFRDDLETRPQGEEDFEVAFMAYRSIDLEKLCRQPTYKICNY